MDGFYINPYEGMADEVEEYKQAELRVPEEQQAIEPIATRGLFENDEGTGGEGYLQQQ